MEKIWQAANARHHFSALVDEAMKGAPQVIRRRDGREVVLISREYFEKTKPNLKSYLMSEGYAEGEDAFDAAMRGVRSGPPLFEPRDTEE